MKKHDGTILYLPTTDNRVRSVLILMPERNEIPQEYFDFYCKKPGSLLFNDWFFKGLTKLNMVPKPGIDTVLAINHIRTIMGSFEPQHEYKTAACGYLLDLWFEKLEWETSGGETL